MSKVTHLKWDVLVGVDPTVGLTTGDLVSEWVHHPDGFVGYDLVWTDTTEGEIVVELSNNGSTVIKSMAYNDADWKLQLTNPAGADGTGKCELYTTASYSRVKYNVTAGTGQLTGTVTSKPLALGIVDIPVPLNLGGTGATTAAGARTSLGLAVPNKGSLRVGSGSDATTTLEAGTDGSLLAYDSTQTGGMIPLTKSEIFRVMHSWHTMASLAVDFANGFCQRIVLANGVNAFTGFVNAIPGVTYKLKLIQPASGAAGTITLTPTTPNAITVGGGLGLSLTNNKANYLFLTLDDTGDGVFSAFVSMEF